MLRLTLSSTCVIQPVYTCSHAILKRERAGKVNFDRLFYLTKHMYIYIYDLIILPCQSIEAPRRNFAISCTSDTED